MLFQEFFKAAKFKVCLLIYNILKLIYITLGKVRIFMKTDRWKRKNIHDPLFQNPLETEEGNFI
jgi:hypothetical protein